MILGVGNALLYAVIVKQKSPATMMITTNHVQLLLRVAALAPKERKNAMDGGARPQESHAVIWKQKSPATMMITTNHVQLLLRVAALAPKEGKNAAEMIL